MNQVMRDKIERNHAMACALQAIVWFTDRPDFLGGPMTVEEAIEELTRQGGYGVTKEELAAAYARIQIA